MSETPVSTRIRTRRDTTGGYGHLPDHRYRIEPDPAVVLATQLNTPGDLKTVTIPLAAVDHLLAVCMSAGPTSLAIRVPSPGLSFPHTIEKASPTPLTFDRHPCGWT